MDNPNPIRYSDLIAPDNSIQNLIAQLDELIAKYDAAKSKIQGSAAEAVKSMQNLSGATEEQREQISLLTKQSDLLTKAYKESADAESETYRRRQQVISAVKEQQRIDKLVMEINNSKIGSYNRLSAQYRLNKIRLNEMSLAERQGTQFGRELETETRKIYEEMSRLQKATGKYTLEVGHYENALRGLPGPIGQVVNGFSKMGAQLKEISATSAPGASKALKMLTVVGLGVVGMLVSMGKAMASTIKTNAEFEQANANLSTILGVSRKDMQNLTDSALSLGRTTEYTASQVTQLQTELAKLGYGQGSIMNMQKSVLQFATAVGANLADAASVAGSTLRAFGLQSKDTEETLATLAVATNNSALNFDRIKQSVGTVFPVAKSFGLTVKDTTALLGALANAGFDASSAATATRNILLRMADANGKLAKSLGGPVKSFDEIIDGMKKLRAAGVDLNTALEMTDRRSVAAFTALLSGADSAKELRASLEDVSGELDRIQRERLDTVEGSTKLLKSAWEGFTLALRDSNGAIKSTIDWLTRLVGAMQAALFPNQTIMQSQADNFVEQFTEIYRKSGAEAVKSVIASLEKTYGAELKKAKIIATDDGLINKWLGIGKEQKGLQQAQNTFDAFQKASNIVTEQIKNDAEEAAKAEAMAADEAAKAKKIADEKAAKAAKKQRLADLRAVVEAINNEIAVTEAGTKQMLKLRQDKIDAQRQVELEQNRQKVKSERLDEKSINDKYDKMKVDDEKKFNAEVAKMNEQRLRAEEQALQMQIQITKEYDNDMLALRLALIKKQEEIELEQNKQKDEKLRQDEKVIRDKYADATIKAEADFNTKLAKRNLKALQERQEAEFSLESRNERQKSIFRLQQEKARLEAVLKMNETAAQKMTEDEVKAVQATIKAIEKEAGRMPFNNLYEVFGIGLDSEQQDALNTALGSVKDAVGQVTEAWLKEKEAAVDAAKAQVDAAQQVLNAEIEARNNGYANSVETAQKELELARSNQEKAERERQKAQRAQLAADSIEQSSSLITATANIWKALSGIPLVGPGLAITAITTMWASFVASKIKASQVAGIEKYGEGTVELLEGGSHASGHDIDLGRKKDGTRRRAEGGEFFAVINKKSSKKFRNVIPDVINSLNNGTFADRYERANTRMGNYAIGIANAARTDVTGLERDVAAIRKQGDESRFVDGDGNTVIRYRNLTRKIIKN